MTDGNGTDQTRMTSFDKIIQVSKIFHILPPKKAFCSTNILFIKIPPGSLINETDLGNESFMDEGAALIKSFSV
jgi:hypothetical protein